MVPADRSRPMPVKYWSFAGLVLTYRCNARCASCYVCSSPQAGAEMTVPDALEFWAGLSAASPHGCRIHVGGGEPFVVAERLIELARRARAAGLGPLEAVETNAFWADSPRTVRDRIAALDDAGMGRLTISADPYHQQFVPIERVRLAARVAGEVLGDGRVRVRWRDWAESGFDTSELTPPRRAEVFAEYARRRRDRFTGRAAVELAPLGPLTAAENIADKGCGPRLLRCRHVHVDAEGILCPGTCAGIVLGRATDADSIGRMWKELAAAFGDAGGDDPGSDVLAVLVRRGPRGLAALAEDRGYVPRREGYADKCHLCWEVRRWLFENGHFHDRLGPGWVYRP